MYNKIKATMVNEFIQHVAGTLTVIDIDSYTDICDVLDPLLDDWNSAYEVVYHHEALDIIRDYKLEPNEPMDFSTCETALDCIMREARDSIYAVEGDAKAEVKGELEEAIQHLINVVNKPSDYFNTLSEGKEEFRIHVSNYSRFGWSRHDEETEDGLCFYSALEGELTAFEHSTSGLYFSVSWSNE